MESVTVRKILVAILQSSAALITLLAVAVIHEMVVEGFRNWPEIAFIQPFITASIIIGTVLLLVVEVETVAICCASVTRMSDKALATRLRITRATLLALTAYMLVAFVIFWATTGLMHFTILTSTILLSALGLAASGLFTARLHNLRPIP
ncbi:hypothetical protein BW13_02750 [Bifidobacterium sp. UTCIF-37]|uniref:hypothetical protein n=1 Tax=unclassified Bifidobacterium TaxID=2608897 RepID=UPI00112CB664|nr:MULTISPECIES: hypothetical protein [unclassified Bifidobacterium]TPF86887.1 hypothetical protein BW13_02750 [Bifidobacterium sp. UTCIF-37]TPF90419.1 hypothetical protein BW11_02340 [Bifidobacterium sp. UTCIF-38]